MRQPKFTFKSKLTALCALAAAAMIGCAGEIEDGDLQDEGGDDYQFALLQPQWTFCANQYQRCSFSGTKQVRFGKNGTFTTRSFTNGVSCTNRSFGVRFSTGNKCEVLLDVEVDAGAAPKPVVDAGTAPKPVADAGAATDAGHTHTPAADAGTAMMGPYINNAKIPTGDPGVGIKEIRTTSEQPNPNQDVGAFRTSCMFSHMNYDDPIVFPGQPGKAHLHAYFGNTAANAYSTPDSVRNSGNSTCRGGIANRSAYWVPAVIDKDGTPIKPESAQIYYKTGYNGIAPSAVKVFPQGLRMIAGNAKAQTKEQNDGGYWGCETYVGHTGNIPSCVAGDQVVMFVTFPQCWNGKDLDSADHKSHMAYPSRGACPSTHPVAIPEIAFNIYYKVPAGSNSANWRLSSDMYDPKIPGGFSAHGDWFEGWDRQVAETFVTRCLNPSSDCHSHLLGDGRMIFNSRETY
jgi:hypothetical protein